MENTLHCLIGIIQMQQLEADQRGYLHNDMDNCWPKSPFNSMNGSFLIATEKKFGQFQNFGLYYMYDETKDNLHACSQFHAH